VVFQAFDVDGNERRALQQQQTVEVTFDGCVFVGNHYPSGVPGVGLRQLGLITMRSSAGGILNVTNSLFVHNEFVVTESNVRKKKKKTHGNHVCCRMIHGSTRMCPHRM
jgi:hypothetical protein